MVPKAAGRRPGFASVFCRDCSSRDNQFCVAEWIFISDTEAKLGMEVSRCTLEYHMPGCKLYQMRTLPSPLHEPSVCTLYFGVHENIHTLTSFHIPFKTNPFESDHCKDKIPTRSNREKNPTQSTHSPLQTITFCHELKASSFI